jgi:transposase
MRVAETIELDAATEHELRVLSKGRRIEARLQQRARVILLAAQGWQNKDISVEVDLDRRQVALWRSRFKQGGIDALRQDAPRSGRTPTVTPELESKIVQVTLHTKPAAATHWSTRTLAQHLGLSQTMVGRVWRRNGIKPHLARTFKLSRDPRFEDKLVDVVGLYLNPPEHALVLSCDEKSQIQALNRTQPGLPMKRGRSGTFTHDYKRHDATFTAIMARAPLPTPAAHGTFSFALDGYASGDTVVARQLGQLRGSPCWPMNWDCVSLMGQSGDIGSQIFALPDGTVSTLSLPRR